MSLTTIQTPFNSKYAFLYAVKISSRNKRKIKIFSDIGKQRECGISKPISREKQKEVLRKKTWNLRKKGRRIQ